MDSSKKYLEQDTEHVEWYLESHRYFANISKLKEHSKRNKESPEKNKVKHGESYTTDSKEASAQKEKITTDSNVFKNPARFLNSVYVLKFISI